jgi:polar amino acid transport system substrate-binding protein
MKRRWPWAVGLVVVVLLTGLVVLRSRQAPPKASTEVFRWGADEKGGAPYVYMGDNNELTGFEVDIANELARRLGMRSHFVSKSWENLPEDLMRGDIDVILNGYEWSPARERQMASTIPYYNATVRLMVPAEPPKGKAAIDSWDDLRKRNKDGSKKRVAVQRGALTETYMRKAFSNDVDILAFKEGTDNAMRLVRNSVADATVQDDLTAGYYAEHGFQDLRFPDADREVPGRGYYVMFVRPQDTDLRDRINDALRQMMEDGTLKAIYEKRGIWSNRQEGLAQLAEHWPPEDVEPERTLLDEMKILLKSAGVTVVLAFLSFPVALVCGLFIGLGRLYAPRTVSVPLTAYVEMIRGTPILLQFYVIYYLLPYAGITLSGFAAGLFGLALNYSAYEAENARAGLLAVPKGQMEAALALGMSRWRALRHIIIPQALRIVVPPVTNDFISLFKDTSICSVVAVTELTGGYEQLRIAEPDHILRLAALTTILYLLMSYPLSLVARRLEKRAAKVTV